MSAPAEQKLVPRLEDTITACLFDLDGVLTQTARSMPPPGSRCSTTSCWSRRSGPAKKSAPSSRATTSSSWTASSARTASASFLASRGIELPEGSPDDPTADTVHGLGTRKNELMLELATRRVDVYDGSVRFVEAVERRAAAGPWCRRARTAGSARGGGDRAPVRGARGRRGRGRQAACTASPRRTCSWPRREALGVAPPKAAVFEDADGRRGGWPSRRLRVGRRRRPRGKRRCAWSARR